MYENYDMKLTEDGICLAVFFTGICTDERAKVVVLDLLLVPN